MERLFLRLIEEGGFYVAVFGLIMVGMSIMAIFIVLLLEWRHKKDRERREKDENIKRSIDRAEDKG